MLVFYIIVVSLFSAVLGASITIGKGQTPSVPSAINLMLASASSFTLIILRSATFTL